MKLFVNYLLIGIILVCCTDERYSPPDDGADFYPLQVGNFHIYRVAERNFSQGSETQREYQLKTEVVDSFPSSESEFTFVINRFTRSEDSDPWHILDTWSVRKTRNRLIMTEGNLQVVTFRFPPKKGLSWDGNEFNSLPADEFEISDLQSSFQQQGMTFGETASVTQENNDDRIVFYDLREERYASGVGLIYRKIHQLEYCTLDPCLGQQQVESGIEYVQELIAYGRS